MKHLTLGIVTVLASKLCSALIADDPYQYEQAPSTWLEREVERLSIKRAWGTITPQDHNQLQIIERTIEMRGGTEDRW